MKTFLQSVAQDLYSKIGNDLSRTAIVFPNKRASLFFNEYLAAQSDRPLWSPAYVNISELFRSLSPLKPGDPIRLVCELYKVFREETHSEEPLDDFYFWGELLISDFDDADKNLVDADKLFSNLQDLKNIMDDYDFLDQEQEEAIQQFSRTSPSTNARNSKRSSSPFGTSWETSTDTTGRTSPNWASHTKA